jgi:hypothetical protein
MSLILRYTSGSTYTLVAELVGQEYGQELAYAYHIPGSDSSLVAGNGLSLSKITIKGMVETKTAVDWQHINGISLDSGTSYQTVVFSSVDWQDDRWSSIYPFTLTLVAYVQRVGASVRIPLADASPAYKWGAQSLTLVAHGGNANASPKITLLPPLLHFPLSQSLASYEGTGITFTRAAAKTHGGISYGINTPAYDNGLYLASDTSTDVGKLTFTTATVRSISMQVKKTYAAGGDHLTVWTAAKNKLTIDCQAGTDTISWTDDTTTVTATFPSSDWDAGTLIDIVVIDGASHAVTLAVHAAGGAWEVHTGTLAAIEWPELTLGPLEGSIANLTEFDYALTSAEYQALVYSLAPWQFNTLRIPLRYAGTTVKDGQTLVIAGSDHSGLLGGSDVAVGAANVTLTEAGGVSCRWYAELARMDTP